MGDLGINGDANLFLINPNSIIFSEGASININAPNVTLIGGNINLKNWRYRVKT